MAWPVAEVDARESLSNLAETLAAGEFGAVPVLSASNVVGLVSEPDVVTWPRAPTCRTSQLGR